MAGAGADRLGGALWIALGVAITAGAWQMDRYTSMGGTLYTAPGLVPGLYGLLMVVLGAVLALRRPRGPADAPAAAAAPDGSAASDPAGTGGAAPTGPVTADTDADTEGPLLNRRIGLALLLMLAYAAVLVGRVPFGPATALFVAAFCGLFDVDAPPRRRIATAVLAGLGTAIVVVLVFERVFLVRLP